MSNKQNISLSIQTRSASGKTVGIRLPLPPAGQFEVQLINQGKSIPSQITIQNNKLIIKPL